MNNTKGNKMKKQNIYQENGYDSRNDYLESLADEYNIDINTVQTCADMYGPSEDFDGLLTTLQDYSDVY